MIIPVIGGSVLMQYGVINIVINLVVYGGLESVVLLPLIWFLGRPDKEVARGAGRGSARPGEARRGWARLGAARPGTAGRGAARQGRAWRGRAWQGMAGHGEVRKAFPVV